MEGLPYRSRARTRSVRRFTFFHARFIVACAFAPFALVAIMSSLTTPRTIRVECEPVPGPVVKCRSFARSLWGESAALRSRFEGSALGDPIDDPEESSAADRKKDQDFSGLELEIE